MGKRTFFQLLTRPLIGLTLLSLLPVVPVAVAGSESGGATDPNCLYLTGEVVGGDQTVNMHQPVTIQYNVIPGGTYTESVRDPVDISMLLDVSKSMNERMVKTSETPNRITALKLATSSLLNDLNEMKAGDRVGIVKFSTFVNTEMDLTTNYEAVKFKVDTMVADGYTNMEGALQTSASMLSASDRHKFAIMVTDGNATAFTTATGKVNTTDYTEARKRTLAQADLMAKAGIPVYTIALGSVGTKEIDHLLLEEISKKTKGEKFDAANAAQLSDVFRNITRLETKEGKLSNIEIRQPLPDGFELADDNPSNVRIEGRTLIITMEAIGYPFTIVKQTATVKLKQVSKVGEFTFANADLNYRNACDSDKIVNVKNGIKIKVSGWVDKWGNLYTGDVNGDVSRFRLGNVSEKQFTVKGSGKIVTNITFADSPDSDDDAIVNVTYEGGMKASWNLRPTEPTVQIKDVGGRLITDSKWHKGNGSFHLSGSKSQLPIDTQIFRDEFNTGYIAGYQYRIDGGVWTHASGASSINLNKEGKDIKVEARAYTTAVSGDPRYPTNSDASDRKASLDATPPTLKLTIVKTKETDMNPTLELTAEDKQSPIEEMIAVVDGKTLKKSGGGKDKVVWELKMSDFTAAAGWKKVIVTASNEAGWTTSKTEFVVLNPGPSGTLETSDGSSYVSDSSSKPVTLVLTDVDKVIVPKRADCATCEEITLKSVVFKVKTTIGGRTTETPWSKLGAFKFQVNSAGTNEVTVKLTDSKDNIKEQKMTVKIDYNQKRY